MSYDEMLTEFRDYQGSKDWPQITAEMVTKLRTENPRKYGTAVSVSRKVFSFGKKHGKFCFETVKHENGSVTSDVAICEFRCARGAVCAMIRISC
jgi:hypothetical protein